jgi:hypothetical protein
MGPRFHEDDGGVCVDALRKFLDSEFQTAKLSRSRGAKRPRFASPSRTARGDGAVGGARAPMGTLEAGLMDPPRAARHRARPRQGAAPPSAPPATRPSTVPGRPGPASFRSVRCSIASRKRPLIGQDAGRISEVLRTGIGIHSQVREQTTFVPRTQRSVLGSALCAARAQAPLLRSGALQSRGRNEHWCLVRSRFCEAARRALHRTRDTKKSLHIYRSTIHAGA